jgi:hypothetical protein
MRNQITKLTVLISIVLSSCELGPLKVGVNRLPNGFTVIEMDSCEYIYNSALSGQTLAHKGNCKY